jgi:TolB-like protein/Tfp pilus assembly protein PilF
MANEMANLRDHTAEPSSEDRLNSWKEIAAYLKCSERTVRRWEEEGLPVHRHPHKAKAAIYAYRAEIDAWWRDGHDRPKQIEDLQGDRTADATALWKRPWLAAGLALATLLITFLARNPGGWRSRLLGANSSPHIQSLAVLPLQNLSQDPEQEYFAEGMTDALITDLAQISSLKVISRTSSMRYKQSNKSLPEIARELNVDGVVEGTVQRSGDHVRISAQLIEAPKDRHLWAGSYERDVRDVLALQGEVARDIATQIRVKLTSDTQKRLSNPQIIEPAAYEDYLRAHYFFERWNAEGRGKALDYFRHAIAKDQRFAAAYAGLADTLALRSYFGESTMPDERANGIAAAEKAVTLDGSLAEAHASVGFALLLDLQLANAERELRSSVSLNPNCSTCHVWYAYYMTFVRRFPDAAQEMNKAQALDPVSSMTYVAAGVMRYFSRDFDDAIRQYQKAIELDRSNPEAYKNLADAYLEKQNCSEATKQFVRSEELLGHDRNASVLTKAFRTSGCRRMLGKQLQLYSDPENPDYYPMYAAALWFYWGEGSSIQIP